MAVNEDLKRYGIIIPSIIPPNQAAGYGGGATTVPQHQRAEVMPKMYMQQKWFKTYEDMIRWKSQNGISDAKMVKMQRPYRGYRYQLHYNSSSVTSKSRSLVE
jgi:hypothetical protein